MIFRRRSCVAASSFEEALLPHGYLGDGKRIEPFVLVFVTVNGNAGYGCGVASVARASASKKRRS